MPITEIIKNWVPDKSRVIDLGCGQRPYEKDILEVVDKYMGTD